MEHKTEDVEVGVLVVERFADEFVARELEDPVMKHGILPREGRIAQTFVAALAAAHHTRHLPQDGQLLFIHC